MSERRLLSPGVRRLFWLGCVIAAGIAVFMLVRGPDNGPRDNAGRASATTTTTLSLSDQKSRDAVRDGMSVDEYQPLRWIRLLGGNGGIDEGYWARYSDPSGSDLGAAQASAASAVARAVVTADATGQGREAFPSYFRSEVRQIPCGQFSILGAAADRMPSTGGDNYAVAQVLWVGNCPEGGSALDPAVTRVYLEYVAGAWRPVMAKDIS